jgi:hypothetical protein
MDSELPSPEPSPVGLLSPTAANDLLQCAYRLAWRMDSRFQTMRRPSPWSELGVVAHAVVEDIARGLLRFKESEADARLEVEKCWETHAAAGSADLMRAWAPAVPPPPEEWPGYHLIRARTIRKALRNLHGETERRPSEGTESVEVERPLEDGTARLYGRPDRVEGRAGDRCVVDLKTGLNQHGATESQRRQLLLYCHLVKVASGELPRRVAIEDPAGRRWEEPVTPAEVETVVAEVESARSTFENSAKSRQLEALASPDPDTCRWCTYRRVCGPYWARLETAWQHGSVYGVTEGSTRAAAGSVLQIRGVSPTDTAEQTWTVSAVPPHHVPEDGTVVSITDAEITGTPLHLRWRWSTLAWTRPSSVSCP